MIGKNSAATRNRIKKAFWLLYSRNGKAFYEHDLWWLYTRKGEYYSVVEASGPPDTVCDGLAFEQIL